MQLFPFIFEEIPTVLFRFETIYGQIGNFCRLNNNPLYTTIMYILLPTRAQKRNNICSGEAEPDHNEDCGVAEEQEDPLHSTLPRERSDFKSLLKQEDLLQSTLPRERSDFKSQLEQEDPLQSTLPRERSDFKSQLEQEDPLQSTLPRERSDFKSQLKRHIDQSHYHVWRSNFNLLHLFG